MSVIAFQAQADPIAANTPPPLKAIPIEDIFIYGIDAGLICNSIDL